MSELNIEYKIVVVNLLDDDNVGLLLVPNRSMLFQNLNMRRVPKSTEEEIGQKFAEGMKAALAMFHMENKEEKMRGDIALRFILSQIEYDGLNNPTVGDIMKVKISRRDM